VDVLYVVQTVTKFTRSLSMRRAPFAPNEASKGSLVILGGAKSNSHKINGYGLDAFEPSNFDQTIMIY
jgi:hypothetical protein